MDSFEKFTEAPSQYRHLEKMALAEVLRHINEEDQVVPGAVARVLPDITRLAEAVLDQMLAGGRLFYIGAGTSGRLAVVDASECPPTYGVPPGLVVAIIAGGTQAITQAVEGAEDDVVQGWRDLEVHQVSGKDFVIGIAASGTTPYVIGALKACNERGIPTGCITNNPGSPLTQVAGYPVAVAVGPEFVTGSTRMKSGTAQKLVLNMVSTSVMIGLGRVEDNRMVHMQLTNEKLVERGTQMVMEQLNLNDSEKARSLLLEWGSVKKAVEAARRLG